MVHLRTFLAGCVFTLAVWAATSLGAPLKLVSPPSNAQRIEALTKRVDSLQNRVAQVSRAANQAQLSALDALDFTTCITQAVWVSMNPETGLIQSADGSEASYWIVPTLDEACVPE